MTDRKVIKECELCGKTIKSNSSTVMLEKMKSHLESCHPGFKTVRNDFNQEY